MKPTDKIVATEINLILEEKGLPHLDVFPSMRLEELGFDSLQHVVLLIRLETKLSCKCRGDVSLAVVVGDLVKLFDPEITEMFIDLSHC